MTDDLRERVLHEASAWVWVPPDAVDRTTDEYRVTTYPDRTSVQWSTTDRLPGLVDELLEVARAAGHPLRWWVSGRTRPADTGDQLASRGFEVTETLDVLARPLAGLPEALRAPGDVQVVPADDEQTIRLAGRLGAEVFGEDDPTEAQVEDEVHRAALAAERGRWEVRRFVAHLDGRPVGSAGYTLVGGTLRLWGGGVVSDARGRGVYRALLAARAADGLRQGADLALVKGRVATSAPVLRRAGFATYDQEVCWQEVRPSPPPSTPTP